jgi:hypothetical protein
MRSLGFSKASPYFKLTLTPSAVLSVTTDLSVSTNKNLDISIAPLTTTILYRPRCAKHSEQRSLFALAVPQYRLLALKGMPFSLPVKIFHKNSRQAARAI